jgi:peptidoglycan/xylan/chitin deacetylase (PgdA/CDA1 family)
LCPMPELISNLTWLLSNPIDLNGLWGDIWAWASVPHIEEVLFELLSILEKHNVSSTFFISGVCARQNKDAVQELSDAGHEIGLHGYRHVPYEMPNGGVFRDMAQAVSVFKEMGIKTEGFRAPWLVADEETYRAAQLFGLKYVSNINSKKSLHWLDKFNLMELPIYLEDQSLLQKNAVEILLKSAAAGRVFEFHLLYLRRSMEVLDEFLSQNDVGTATLAQIAKGRKSLGLSFDIAYLHRFELLRKLLS